MKHSNMIKTYHDEISALTKKKDELLQEEIDEFMNPEKKGPKNKIDLAGLKKSLGKETGTFKA